MGNTSKKPGTMAFFFEARAFQSASFSGDGLLMLVNYFSAKSDETAGMLYQSRALWKYAAFPSLVPARTIIFEAAAGTLWYS